MPDPKYEYAVLHNGGGGEDTHSLMRLREGEKLWEWVSDFDNGDTAKDVCDDLNRAQRLKVRLEPGQELRKPTPE
jgi:hypothetical protein